MTRNNTIEAGKTRERQTAEALEAAGLEPEALPRHIAIIMDGNGRWAKARGKARIYGHRQGAKAVRAIVTECARLECDVLTLYSFSIENWQRPADEINVLMDLYVEYLIAEREELIQNNVKFTQIGRREGLPARVLDELDMTSEATHSCEGLTLVLALNYSSRTEIVDAVRAIGREIQTGLVQADQIDEGTVTDHLYTAGLPDPDLLIRTAGEMRVSNYLLWQISYAELYVTQVCWPDFTVEELRQALRAFAQRNRKFGGVTDT